MSEYFLESFIVQKLVGGGKTFNTGILQCNMDSILQKMYVDYNKRINFEISFL